jgi:methylmalonyl-CoA decarboxylase
MTPTQTALIQTKVSDNIATIAFDNYAKRNALSAALITETLAALEHFKAKDVRAVVLRSAASEEIWSAGHDMKELPKGESDPMFPSLRNMGKSSCARSTYGNAPL